jgi:hypothetical protein
MGTTNEGKKSESELTECMSVTARGAPCDLHRLFLSLHVTHRVIYISCSYYCTWCTVWFTQVVSITARDAPCDLHMLFLLLHVVHRVIYTGCSYHCTWCTVWFTQIVPITARGAPCDLHMLFLLLHVVHRVIYKGSSYYCMWCTVWFTKVVPITACDAPCDLHRLFLLLHVVHRVFYKGCSYYCMSWTVLLIWTSACLKKQVYFNKRSENACFTFHQASPYANLPSLYTLKSVPKDPSLILYFTPRCEVLVLRLILGSSTKIGVFRTEYLTILIWEWGCKRKTKNILSSKFLNCIYHYIIFGWQN